MLKIRGAAIVIDGLLVEVVVVFGVDFDGDELARITRLGWLIFSELSVYDVSDDTIASLGSFYHLKLINTN